MLVHSAVQNGIFGKLPAFAAQNKDNFGTFWNHCWISRPLFITTVAID